MVDEGIAGSYTDPVRQHSRKTYLQFIRMLYDRGLVSFAEARKIKTKCGLFFVTKRDGKIRLIIDARRANQKFRKPPSGSTTGLAALESVRVAEGEALYSSTYDVKDFSIG